MGLAGIASSMGAHGRAESELNLLKNESMKRVRADSSLANARGQELDSVAREASESARTLVDKVFQVKAAEEAKEAAKAGFIGALANIATSVFSGFAGSGSWTSAAIGSMGSVFSALGAYFAMQGAKQEEELLKMQFGDLSAEADADKKATDALVANGL